VSIIRQLKNITQFFRQIP